ncbi:ABC transporter ATP-binding protein [Curtobacterium sp. RHCJP20]|uniref:ABC transporter ATP-binding protein n=1 Tax=Curtobacterium subtropicum TaxID=3055138 RepID=A0ABT7TBT9_9MICO|nr:ABC transporter ATP-binding protein [Curtobacterium subtropicum]MDM7887028.1 ABC transporter ATP-binding protein [Curtobacterium subtropicum]
MTTVSSSGAARVAFRDWGWRYAGRDAWAVRGLDLVVEPGERVAVVGPSGAGKSTVLRAVAAVLADEPDPDDDTAAAVQGSVLVDDADPRAVRGRVGLVMQDPEAHTVMSRIGDDVAFGCENTGVPRAETWERVRHALGVVGLDLPLDRSTSRLSGGQRQRLALAGVLAMRPGVLVLDEPCANLDPEGVAQVHSAVRALLDATGATMLVVEHRIGTWLDLVDRLVLLAPGGGVVADGAPATVLAEHGAALTAAGVWVPGAGPARGSSRAGGGPSRDGGATPGGGGTSRGAGAPSRSDVHPSRADLRPSRAGGTAPGAPLDDGTFRPFDGGAVLLEALGLATARGSILRRTGGTRVGSDIHLGVRRGRVLAVTGPNGVGKSTLGLTLAGLLRPAGGTLRATPALAGDAGAEPHRWTSRQLASRIGTVFQDPGHQFVARSVREELAAGPRALGLPDADERVEDLLDRFGLRHLADANPFTLSGGEQRRLAIGAVVASRPPVVVLDEPTSGQDRATWQAVVDLLGATADAGTALVVVTHDRDLVRALDADEVVLAADGAHPASTTSGGDESSADARAEPGTSGGGDESSADARADTADGADLTRPTTEVPR